MTSAAAVRLRISRPQLARALFALIALSTVAMIPLTLLSHQYFNGVVPLVIGAPSAVTGILIARRQPRNPIGWLLLALAICLMVGNDGSDYATLVYGLGYHLPFGLAGPLLGQLWGPGIELLGPVILLFPDGRLTSPWWRWALRGYVAVFAVSLLALCVATGVVMAGHNPRVDANGGFAVIDNPSGWYALVTRPSDLLTLAFIVTFVLRQVLSWRGSSGERRQQLKWLAAGGATVPVSLVLGTSGAAPYLGAIGWLGLATLPVCIGVAILKYRLYDIDRIISRTLSYTIVTGLLVGLYIGLVALVTGVLGFTSQVGVAASTLAAAALFSPLRRRVQHLVDRRFNRARYNAEQTIAAFAARLQDAVDVQAVRADLVGVISQAVEPAHVSVWLSGAQR